MPKTESFSVLDIVHQEIVSMRAEVVATHKTMADSIAQQGSTQAIQTTILQRLERVQEKMILWLVGALILGLLGAKGLDILARSVG